jgi:hypothetical protein
MNVLLQMSPQEKSRSSCDRPSIFNRPSRLCHFQPLLDVYPIVWWSCVVLSQLEAHLQAVPEEHFPDNHNMVGSSPVKYQLGAQDYVTVEDYTTFSRDRNSRDGDVFICVRDCIACAELWMDEDFEIISVQVKGRDHKFIWEIEGIYRALNEDVRVIERLAARTDYLGNSTKRSLIWVHLNLPCIDWNGNAECTNGSQVFVNRLA